MAALSTSLPGCRRSGRSREIDGGRREPPPLLIRGGSIVGAAGRIRADIRVQDGAIVEIGPDLAPVAHACELDARELLILPGGVDPHVHLTVPKGAPAVSHGVDDLTSGSAAAFAGGITCLGNMTFPAQHETPRAAIERDAATVSKLAMADVMLHPVIIVPTRRVIEEIPDLVRAGHTSVKMFTCIETFDQHALHHLIALRVAAEAGALTMIHCEDFAILSLATAALANPGSGSVPASYPDSRPLVAEVAAIQRAIAFSEAVQAPIYLVHLSSARALEVAVSARARGVPVFVETRPIYLALTQERYRQGDGALYVSQPPLRDPEDVAALWRGLAAGQIDTMGSDHVGWGREQKLDPDLGLAELRPGMADLELMLPLLHSEGVVKGRITLERMVELTSTRPAQIFGLFPRKGTIAVGSDADLVLFDPTATRTIDGKMLQSRAGYSVYEGAEFTGWPRTTIRRGEVVFDRGQVLAQPGSGQLLLRKSAGA